MTTAEMINNPHNISLQIRAANNDRDKAIDFINNYKDYATSSFVLPGDEDIVMPYIGDMIGMVILLLKKVHNITPEELKG